MIKFNAPYYLLLLLPLIISGWHIFKHNLTGEIVFGSVLSLPKTKPTWRIIMSRLLPTAYLTALILLVIAMAKPQSTISKKQIKTNAIAIEMVIDTSGSMETTTTNGLSRLDIAKDSFTTFIEKRKNDLIGLITFSGYATTKAPLTTNHELLLQLTKSVSTKQNNNSKQESLTAIGDAITTACARLRPAEPKSKIIILITDGMSNAGIITPITAANIAKKLNIRIYPINISQNIEKHTEQATLLKNIANITAGKTFSTTNKKNLITTINEIDKLETTAINTSYLTETTDYSIIFIITALLLIVISTTFNILLTRRLI
jgi:Ca-activated chloride channel family protein